MLYRTITLLYCFVAALTLQATGVLPNVTSFDKSIYKAGRQNWDVKVDDSGVLYFANSEGLLCNVFGEWNLVKAEAGFDIRALHLQGDTIWCGGNGIGFYSRRDGRLHYEHFHALEGEQVWSILSTPTDILFQTEYKIGFYNKTSKQLVFKEIPGAVWCLAHYNDNVWLIQRDGRIGFLEGQEFKEVAVLPELGSKEVRRMFVHNNELYLVLFEGGLYRFNGSGLTAVKLPESIKDNSLFCGLSYDKNSMCIGTVSSGVCRFDNAGKVLTEVSTNQGLTDNTVLSMATDALGNIWLGLDYGIAKIELQSAVNYLFKGAATYTVKDFKGRRYLGTNKGVFTVNADGSSTPLSQIEGQVWKLREIGNELFICHNRGLYKLSGDKAVPLVKLGGFLDIVQFENTNFFVFSTYHGLILMQRNEDNFAYIANLSIWGNEHLAYDRLHNCVWADIKGQKVYKLTLDDENQVRKEEFAQIKQIFETTHGLYFADDQQLLEYTTNGFVPTAETLLKQLNTSGLSALDYSADAQSMTYIQNGEVKLKVILPDGNLYSYDAILHSLASDILNHYQFIELQNEALILATDRGLVAFDLNFRSEFKKSSAPVISSVTVLNEGGGQLFYPFDNELNLGSGDKSLKFRLGINKSSYDVAEFRYRLLPDNKWSEWTAQNEIVLSGIAGGSYTLTIECRLNGGEQRATELAFVIDKLWYQTGWLALPVSLGFVGLLLLVVLVMSKLNIRKLQRQKQQILAGQAKETLQLKNDQLLQYTEIISHKNEFLIKLKEGLESMRNKDAQRWVNMISEEVSNEKKEFLFHKLFSEVQQDFISRLTEAYPSLTSNDIRMLSFIRINLDKKEISNLMNITIRSLDTNRYRLRKKLDLDQNTDLDQFIRHF